MKNWHVEIAESAEEDLRSIYEYIAFTLFEQQIAKNLIHRLKKRIYKLNNSPTIYAPYPEEPWKSRGLRRVNSGNYAIFFIPTEENEKVVTVLRVIYGGRDIDQILIDMLDDTNNEE